MNQRGVEPLNIQAPVVTPVGEAIGVVCGSPPVPAPAPAALALAARPAAARNTVDTT